MQYPSRKPALRPPILLLFVVFSMAMQELISSVRVDINHQTMYTLCIHPGG